MAIVPVVMGVGMTLLLHEVYMLAMCVMSPVLMVGNHIADGKRGRRSFAQRTAGFREHKARIEQDAAAALGAERQARRMAAAPDPAAVLTIATGPRRPALGAARHRPRLPAAPAGHRGPAVRGRAAGPGAGRAPPHGGVEHPDAPVTVPLTERRRARRGRCAEDEPRALGRWLVAQIAVLHSPRRRAARAC